MTTRPMTRPEEAATRKALLENMRAIRRQIQKRPIDWPAVRILLADCVEISAEREMEQSPP